jgi:hypothetical protein
MVTICAHIRSTCDDVLERNVTSGKGVQRFGLWLKLDARAGFVMRQNIVDMMIHE